MCLVSLLDVLEVFFKCKNNSNSIKLCLSFFLEINLEAKSKLLCVAFDSNTQVYDSTNVYMNKSKHKSLWIKDIC